ncbi:hypothetical protein [Empedobacter sp. GD03739]|uniref:hypothetical protein n=1 Tax=Empedobacter sp. GD03739 TaxID=2975376 RepID=UPI00244681B3|nr:hypothetical protein [Empedobacter sp. GD03739]MDH1604061.1 hypothetical protein [Empedobacter sp. GD03739]
MLPFPLLRKAVSRYRQANLTAMPQNRNLFFIFILISFFSCKEKKKNNILEKSNKITSTKIDSTKINQNLNKTDTIQISKEHKVNTIKCDLDGDNLDEIIQIVRNTKNGKSGLRIIFGNKKKIDHLGLGKDVLNQGFDEIDWAGIFEIAPKNEIYYNNVSDEGEIITEDEVKDEDKIKLKNDGIFIHAEESCGGGVIYLENGKYNWIQQE